MENDKFKLPENVLQGNIVDLTMQMYASGIEKNVAELELQNMQYDSKLIEDVIKKVYGKDDAFRKHYNERIKKFGSYCEKLKEVLSENKDDVNSVKVLSIMEDFEKIYTKRNFRLKATSVYEAAVAYCNALSRYTNYLEPVKDYIEAVSKTVLSDRYAIEAMRFIKVAETYKSNVLFRDSAINFINEVCENISVVDAERTPIDEVFAQYRQLPFIKKYFDAQTKEEVPVASLIEYNEMYMPIIEFNEDTYLHLNNQLYCYSPRDTQGYTYFRPCRFADCKDINDIDFMSYKNLVEASGIFKYDMSSKSFSFMEGITYFPGRNILQIQDREYKTISTYDLIEEARQFTTFHNRTDKMREIMQFIENRSKIADISKYFKCRIYGNSLTDNKVIFFEHKYNHNKFCALYFNDKTSVFKDYKDLNEAVNDMTKWNGIDMKKVFRDDLIRYNSVSSTNEMKKMLLDKDISMLESLNESVSSIKYQSEEQKAAIENAKKLIENYKKKLQDQSERL